MNQGEAGEVGGDDAETKVEDAALNLQEIGETTRGRPFGQAVGMTVTDRDRLVDPDGAGAPTDERRDRP